ncbi:MAG: hypothetical protein C0505_14995 [Leptothrix sp. (in: Bacteria)]|nr:hypothetical protein [Leptothrix sp. (in: b-proteobacteria)]
MPARADIADDLFDRPIQARGGLVGQPTQAVRDDAHMAAWRLQAHQLGDGQALWCLTDHEVVTHVSRLRRAAGASSDGGRAAGLTLYRVAPMAPPAAAAPPPAPARAAGARPGAAASPPPLAATPGALSPELDAPALAQALTVAAAQGTPFVEECERA